MNGPTREGKQTPGERKPPQKVSPGNISAEMWVRQDALPSVAARPSGDFPRCDSASEAARSSDSPSLSRVPEAAWCPKRCCLRAGRAGHCFVLLHAFSASLLLSLECLFITVLQMALLIARSAY